MNLVLQIAGQTVSVNTETFDMTNWFQRYLGDGPCDIQVCICPEEIAFERAKAMQEDILEEIAPRTFTEEYLMFVALQRKITEALFSRDILLFHGSVVAVDGVSYLFTAKSGTGKSTHTRLWREMLGDRAVMVNDDKPFLQLTDHGVIAHGSPWNGKHRLGENISVPLRAICILERSPENWIKSVSAARALPMLFQQSQRPRNPANMPKYMELIDRLANGVEFFRMGCNMDPEAALVSYRAMSRERKDE